MTPSSIGDGCSLPDKRRLRTLIGAHCDANLSEDEFDELAAMLLASEDARGQFLEELSVHGWLENEVPARRDVSEHIRTSSSMPAAPVASDRPLVAYQRTPSTRILGYAVAASLVLAVAAASFVGWTADERLGSSSDDVAQLSPVAKDSLIAQASPVGEGCNWRLVSQSRKRGEGEDRSEHSVRAGDTLRVTRGRLRLDFDHGTQVDLQAPALYEVGSAMRTRLYRGRATVKVAEGAEGFTIDTPGASVIDLGTEFGVEVDSEGQTDVVVFEGMVDVSIARDLGGDEGAELDRKRLFGGGAMHINRQGTASRISWLPSDRFTHGEQRAEPSSRKPLITSVSDNLNRRETWSFYEIVSGGMREDSKAFVDRQHHEWNGVEQSGMPEYLLGGDYVRTFNDDKVAGQIEIEVELSAPAQLYVLWCDRIPAPAWLVRDFEQTGDYIGVDEGDHVFPEESVVFRGATAVSAEHSIVRRGPSGIGPGKSIDARHSVWRRVVKHPGTVRLGALETKKLAINMYGIVATPLSGASD